MNSDIYARDREVAILEKQLISKKAELIALYGRRRVGKTYLVRHVMSQSDSICFEFTGRKNASKRAQLENFQESIKESINSSIPLKTPSSWKEAFQYLSSLIRKDKNTILFFDELPWLATRKSGLLEELDYFWNTKWSKISNLKVILCGSSASWMLENLIHAKGGLHNRITKTITLEPFNLSQTKEYLEAHNIHLTKRQVVELFLCTGGVPFYLSSLSQHNSPAGLIDEIAFSKDGLLNKEYESLFQSLFDSANTHELIMETLAKKRYGCSRGELASKKEIGPGGKLTRALKELEASGFIKKRIPFNQSSRSAYYQITDEYSLFYHYWIKPLKKSSLEGQGRGYWLNVFNTPKYYSWSGLAFEEVCFKHVNSILKTLSIAGMRVEPSTWRTITTGTKGSQIDLVLDRADGVVNLCEIKFRSSPTKLDQKLQDELLRKQGLFIDQTKTKKIVRNMAIISGGISNPEDFPNSVVDSVLDLNALFS